MKSTILVLGVANSQPAGLSQSHYESVYQDCFRPFLSVLNEFPEIPVSLYYSGPLLEWMESRHPEAIMLLSELVKRKQVEMLGGGYYEPILPMIPNTDRVSHIEAMTTFIRKRFGRRPRGGWLGEMIWEPNQPVSLKNSGIEYTFLEDSYFKIAGARGDELYFPCLTEDQGKTIIVSPVDSDMAAYFLENSAADSFSYLKMRLKNMAKKDPLERNRMLSVFFNTEEWRKRDFGGWIREFFSLIQSEKENFSLELAESFTRTPYPLKKIYFPSLVPGKMLPDRKNIPKHETARNLLSIYPEINLVYSKLVYVSLLISQVRGDKSRKKTARQDLWKAQSSRLYWYPQDQGELFRPIRQEAYRILLSTEKTTRETGIFQPSIVLYDFDMKGTFDYLYQGAGVNVYIRKEGARMFELDYLPRPWNYQDTHCHWMEPRGNRDSFIERFFTDQENPRKTDGGGGFSLDRMLFDEVEVDREKMKVSFRLETRIPDINGRKRPICLIKEYTFRKNGLNLLYEIRNLSDQELDFHFSSELNFHFCSQGPELVFEYITRGKRKAEAMEAGNYRDIKLAEVKDVKNKTVLSLSTSKNCELVTSTQTVEDENCGPLYQGSRFLLGWRKKAEPQKSWAVELSLRLDKQ